MIRVLSWAWMVCAVGCSSEPVVEAPPPPLPALVPDSLASCADSPYPEIADACRVRFSIDAGLKGREALTWESCAAIVSPLWRDECHFLAAGVLGRKGTIGKAMDHCVAAGRYAQNCAVHVAWIKRPFILKTSPDSVTAVQVVQESLAEMSAESRDPAAPEFQAHLDVVRSSLWFEIYYGAGVADPTAAQAAEGLMRVHARSAFAWEAVRLEGTELGTVELARRVVDIWEGRRAPSSGDPLSRPCWLGRNTQSFPAGIEGADSAAHTPHYGTRLVGATEEEDLVIATLEAAHFAPSTSSGAFTAWLEDPRSRVRTTATRLELLLSPTGATLPASLLKIASRWNAGQMESMRGKRRPFWSGSADRAGCD